MINVQTAPTEVWKKRGSLPGLMKLKLKFDVELLREDLAALESRRRWDGLDSEYRSLCEAFDQLPPFFMDGQNTTFSPYEQLALSEFDQEFSLEQRKEKSGTFWDKTSPHRQRRADERFYRKRVGELPQYLTEVLNAFEPGLHRVRFARLAAGHTVKPHIDYDTTYSIRIHIPVQTDPACKIGYRLPDGTEVEEHLPADGSAYFVNQGLLHWATNPSSQPRTHIILSVDSQRLISDVESHEA